MLFGVIGWVFINKWFGIPIFLGGIYFLFVHLYLSKKLSQKNIDFLTGALASFYVFLLLTRRWMPAGIEEGFFRNLSIVLLPTIFWGALALFYKILSQDFVFPFKNKIYIHAFTSFYHSFWFYGLFWISKIFFPHNFPF
jgi:hypothetical protein